MSSDLTITTDPAEVGFDAARLQRLDRRLARWVDDGQLPGFLVTVARHGKLVHVGKGGLRNVEDGLPVEDDTRWRIYSMTKPVTSVAAMMLYEEGAFELERPDREVAARVRRHPGLRGGLGDEAGHRSRRSSRSGSGTCSPTSPGLTYGFHHAHPVDAAYRADGPRVGHPAGRRPRRGLPTSGRRLPLVFQPGSELELRRLHRRPRPARRGDLRPAAGRVLRSSGSSRRSACGTPPSGSVRTTTSTPSPGSTSPRPASPADRRPG